MADARLTRDVQEVLQSVRSHTRPGRTRLVPAHNRSVSATLTSHEVTPGARAYSALGGNTQGAAMGIRSLSVMPVN